MQTIPPDALDALREAVGTALEVLRDMRDLIDWAVSEEQGHGARRVT